MVTPINRFQIPTPAETVDTLAQAMNFQKPSSKQRQMAGEYPVSPQEQAVLVEVYGFIKKKEIRQAVLDVLVSASERQ